MPASRILTTHVGSLPRPDDLIDMLVARETGAPVDDAALAARIRVAVADTVSSQRDAGIDIVGDGEMGKISYVNYLVRRLHGFGARAPLGWTPRDILDHPGIGAALRQENRLPRQDPPACRAPVRVKDRAPLDADLANLRAAAPSAGPGTLFMTAASPGVAALFLPNRFYPGEDAYVEALATALQEEYEAIHAAGFLLQIDCPDLAMSRHFAYADLPLRDFRRIVARNVEALNHATRNIPRAAMRMHLCWGNYPGPHTHDVPLRDIADLIFAAKPQAILFEAANPRHAHEWEDLAAFAIPDDTVLVPGVIDTNTNHVEHPVLVAQRLERFAALVGPGRVMAGTDCGFATLASLNTVYPSVAWAKLRALAEGARIASERLV